MTMTKPKPKLTAHNIGRSGSDHNFMVEDDQGRHIADFTIRRVNGAICFSCKLVIHYPGEGYYKHVHELKLQRARELGYVTMLASVASTNEAELRCIEKYWNRIGRVNGKDNPLLILAVCDL